MSNEIVSYESSNGQLVKFTAKEVKERLCPQINDKELALVMALCQAQKLNPFIGDVHIVKYGDNPASIITGKEVFTKRAQANPKFDGMEAGITVMRKIKHNQNSGVETVIERREGSLMLKEETLVGGWCKVYVKGYRVPMFNEVSFDEYAGRKKDGELNSMWASKGATMIRKVAVCQSLREAFPDDFQGLYGAEEMGKAELDGESETKPLEAITEPEIIDVEPDMTQAQASKLQDLITEFSEICDKSQNDVVDALMNSSALEGVECFDAMTVSEAERATRQLEIWIEKSKEAKAKSEELASEDIEF